MLSAAAVQTQVSPRTIDADRLSYEAGDEVFITGAAWIPNELVTIQIAEDGNPGHIDTLYATADATGAVTAEYVVPGHGSAQNFTVIATSPSMQMPVTTVFSDAGNQGPLLWDMRAGRRPCRRAVRG